MSAIEQQENSKPGELTATFDSGSIWLDLMPALANERRQDTNNDKLRGLEAELFFSDLQQKGKESTKDLKEKKPEEGFQFVANAKEQDAQLLKFNERVNYSKIWPADVQVLFVGEFHGRQSHREEFSLSLPELKKQRGKCALFMEALEHKEKKLIEDYLNNKVDRKAVLDYLDRSWGWRPESYLKVIDTAKKEGITIVAMREESEKKLTPTEKSKVVNQSWAKLIKDYLKDHPGDNIVVLCGAAHCGHSRDSNSVNQFLAKDGISSKVIHYGGGRVGLIPETTFESAIERSARRIGIAQNRFGVPVRPDPDGHKSADYIIYVGDSILRD